MPLYSMRKMVISCMEMIGLGGGCHWCTEAVFSALNGVAEVKQGWIASSGENAAFSEGVMVYFNPEAISLETLIEIHLQAHSCTSEHQLRNKYRSAVYVRNSPQEQLVQRIIEHNQQIFTEPIITKVLPFVEFKENQEKYQNYYFKNPESQFCTPYISPKIDQLQTKFSKFINHKMTISTV